MAIITVQSNSFNVPAQPVAGDPSYQTNTPVGQWSEVPASGFSNMLQAVADDIGVAATTSAVDGAYPGTNDYNITANWSGGARVGDYIYCTGGGHRDGAINGCYRFGPLSSNTPGWQTAMKATPSGSLTPNVSTQPDGKWNANHTYNNCAGVDADNAFWLMRVDAYWLNAFASSAVFRLPEGVNQQPTIRGNSVSAGGAYGGCAVIGTRIYHQNGNGGTTPLTWFDWQTNQTGTIGVGTEQFNNYVAMAADAANDALIVANGSKAIYYSNLSTSPQKRAISAAPGWWATMEFDADRDRYVTLDLGSGSTGSGRTSLSVHELDAAALRAGGSPSWTTRTFTGPPIDGEDNPQGYRVGIYGRFRYSPERRGYYYVQGMQKPVLFFRASA